ncbi:MAG: anthranilate synthase component I family protein [Planctomycetaceae bacterium]|nr:anthranilate synthase component I family protein [Planctomycetaceae bacterium]
MSDLLAGCLDCGPGGLGQLLFESVQTPDTNSESAATFSFWLPRPHEWVMTRDADLADWHRLATKVQGFLTESLPADFPPFVGGAAGLLSYDWCRALEQIPTPARDDFQVPCLAIGIYDHLVALNHATRKFFLIANGFPHDDLNRREQAATTRLAELIKQVCQGSSGEKNGQRTGQRMSSHLDLEAYETLPPTDHFSHELYSETRTATNPQKYQESIERALAYLRSGDIFQVNLAQHLLVPRKNSPTDFYRCMRANNSAPFAAYFDLGNHHLVSASPERLVKVLGRKVQTRPIKGTRRLSGDSEWDSKQAQSLQESTKDCSENVMIVDLLRNDLSRVCAPDSLRVKQLCGLEQYRHVQHLVSVIEGELEANMSAWDLLPAVFPGGSVTGAPKVRAMTIINELEPVARGAYCGSLGYIGFPDAAGFSNADWNILIRTATLCGDWCQIPVGGGIVLDSQPQLEHLETMDKARGLLLAAKSNERAPR